jgi:glycoprotein-N-acetylgalactosamine 3-beta-galactosyltransferase
MKIFNLKRFFFSSIIMVHVLIAYNYLFRVKNVFVRFDPNEPIRLFCMIITTEDVLETHTKYMYDLWVNQCDDHVFVSMIPKKDYNPNEQRPYLLEKEFKILQPPGFESDSYSNLTHKVFLSFKYLYANKKKPFHWYLKADVDTFVFVDNLRNFVKNKDTLDAVTYGFNFKKVVPKGYQSGGAGYILSRESFARLGKVLNENYRFCQNSGVEDIDIARCFRKLSVYPGSSIDELGRERFHPLDFDHHYNGKFNDRYKWLNSYAENPLKKVFIFGYFNLFDLYLKVNWQKGFDCCSNSSISFHYIKEEQALKLGRIFKENKDIKSNVHEVMKKMLDI